MSKLPGRIGPPSASYQGRYQRLGALQCAIGVLSLLISVSAAPVSAQPGQPPPGRSGPQSILDDPILIEDGRAGLSALYNMRFETADSIFSSIETRFPGHPVGPFLKALVIWWQILPTLELGAGEEDARFFAEMDRVIRLSDSMLKKDRNSFDAMFFKGAALGFRGRLKSNRREWLTAAMDGRSTLDYIFKIADADTSNADFQFGRGVYDYFAAVIPEKYPLVRPMMVFFPNAVKVRGLNNLKFTAEKGRFIQTEAAYFLLQIYLTYERDFEQAKKYASWLRDSYPNNAYFHALEGRVFASWGRWAEAAQVFGAVAAEYERGTQGYNDLIASQAHYYIGRSEMISRRMESALENFGKVVEISDSLPTNTYFESFAQLRRGMIFDMSGEREKALDAYRRVLDLRDQGDAHERAKRYIRTPYGGSARS